MKPNTIAATTDNAVRLLDAGDDVVLIVGGVAVVLTKDAFAYFAEDALDVLDPEPEYDLEITAEGVVEVTTPTGRILASPPTIARMVEDSVAADLDDADWEAEEEAQMKALVGHVAGTLAAQLDLTGKQCARFGVMVAEAFMAAPVETVH